MKEIYKNFIKCFQHVFEPFTGYTHLSCGDQYCLLCEEWWKQQNKKEIITNPYHSEWMHPLYGVDTSLKEIILKIVELLSQIRVQSAHFANVLDNDYLSQ